MANRIGGLANLGHLEHLAHLCLRFDVSDRPCFAVDSELVGKWPLEYRALQHSYHLYERDFFQLTLLASRPGNGLESRGWNPEKIQLLLAIHFDRERIVVIRKPNKVKFSIVDHNHDK